jgi:hypothetical protein
LIRNPLAGSIVCVKVFERKRFNKQCGQAAVELLLALPIALFVLTAGWQVVIAGHAWWTVSESARVAARTAYVASEGDKSRLGESKVKQTIDHAAERSLPESMQGAYRSFVDDNGAVTVSARLPLAGPLAAVLKHGPRITARSGIAR